MPIRAASPYQGLVDADPKGVSWGTWTRTTTAGVKAQPTAIFSNSHREPPPGADPGLAPYRGRSQPCAAALCAREDLNLHSPRGPQRPQHCASTCSATGTLEPPPGADPGHPPYEGGAAAVRGGASCPARTRTSIA